MTAGVQTTVSKKAGLYGLTCTSITFPKRRWPRDQSELQRPALLNRREPQRHGGREVLSTLCVQLGGRLMVRLQPSSLGTGEARRKKGGYLTRQHFLSSLMPTSGPDQGCCSAGDIAALASGGGRFSAWVPKFPRWLWHLNLWLRFWCCL